MGTKIASGLVTPARRTKVPVPAQSRDERAGRELAGNRRRIIAGRRQASPDLSRRRADAHAHTSAMVSTLIALIMLNGREASNPQRHDPRLKVGQAD